MQRRRLNAPVWFCIGAGLLAYLLLPWYAVSYTHLTLPTKA